MSESAYDLKSALPNKVLDEEGNITDLFGNLVNPSSQAYINKSSLPNKWLNPDGTYSTLMEIIGGAIDTDIFVIVEELPQTGDPKKIYLVPDGEGGFVEYHYVNGDWDPVGVVEIDLSNYWTISQVQQAIAEALQTSKSYADEKASTAEANAKAYAKSYADGLASQYDAAGTAASEAATAQSNAETYADTKKTEAISASNTYTDTAIQTSITQVLNASY